MITAFASFRRLFSICTFAYISVDKNANPEANNAPDSISFAELQEYAKTAKETMAELKEPKFDGLTQDQLCDLVDEMVALGEEKCGHPMLAKLTIFHLMDKLIEWHSRAGEKLAEDGELRQASGWLKDAGKLQAVCNILSNVEVCEDDFITN